MAHATGRRRVATLLGAGLALAGGGFVVERIVSGWSDYGEVIVQAQWGWSAAGLGLAAVGMAAMGLVWRRVLAALGGRASRRDVVVWYLLGNLGKYLPGGVWALLGRAELAVRGGLPRSLAYRSVALSMGATYLCALIVCALLLPFAVLSRAAVGPAQLWVFALIPVGLAALHPAVLGPVFRLAERRFVERSEPNQKNSVERSGPNQRQGGAAPEPDQQHSGRPTAGDSVVVPAWRTSAGLVAWHALPWLALGGATWLVALTFAPDAPLLPLVFAGILSWVIGFVVVFVPGGIGVREAAFTALAGAVLPLPLAATIAVVSRLVFVAADGLAAAAALAAHRGIRRKPPLDSQQPPG